MFDANGGFVGRGVSVRFMSWSRRSTRRLAGGFLAPAAGGGVCGVRFPRFSGGF